MQSILHNKSCNPFLRTAKDKSFDLLLSDPPYGENGNSHRRNLSRNKMVLAKAYCNDLWQQKKPGNSYFKNALRIADTVIIFGANYFPQITTPFKTPRRASIETFIKENPTNWIIWDKCNGNTNFNDYELAWINKPFETVIFRFMWNGMHQGQSIKNGHIQQPYKHLNEKRIHPTQKPVALYKWLLMKYSFPGANVIDTHAGSGSSRIACIDYGCSYTGFEISKKYYADHQQRFKNYTSQLKLIQ